MKTKQNIQQHITTSLGFLGALLMLLLFSCLLVVPHDATAAAITCSSGVSGCHFTPTVKDGTARNVPAGRFTGSHARHSGYSTGSKRQYIYACTKCHPSTGYTNSHQSGYKNITGSSLPGNRYSAGKKIPNTNSPSFGNCSNIYCHSNGRAAGMGQLQYSSVKWGGTESCLGCHGGRASANGAPARSVGNFTLSTSHSQHLKYPAANMNCQICHSKSVTDAATLKNFTGVKRHANGVRDVTFTGLAYGTYTSYKSTEVGSSGNSKTCNNVSCHGGKTRSAWSSTTINNDNTCVHCHGVAGTSAALANIEGNRKYFAPGWGGTGISTDGIAAATDIRV
ncbi:MAG TPA: CxxxxCH/CxxCH domain-containing protein, partial [Geobacteraceae bacterium]|nr:CxxxxCH/CxxCH domain-containing protein [Geobacteraceae bacterium]